MITNVFSLTLTDNLFLIVQSIRGNVDGARARAQALRIYDHATILFVSPPMIIKLDAKEYIITSIETNNPAIGIKRPFFLFHSTNTYFLPLPFFVI